MMTIDVVFKKFATQKETSSIAEGAVTNNRHLYVFSKMYFRGRGLRLLIINFGIKAY